MRNKRIQILLKASCLVLTLIQIRCGNKFCFPTIGAMLMTLAVFDSYLLPAIYFSGIILLILALVISKPGFVRFTFITGFVLLLIEIAIYQYNLRDIYWSGTGIYLWTAMPFVLLGIFQIILMFMKNNTIK